MAVWASASWGAGCRIRGHRQRERTAMKVRSHRLYPTSPRPWQHPRAGPRTAAWPCPRHAPR